MKSLLILLSLIVVSFNTQSQNLKKAFKYLNDNDFDRSKVIFDEAVSNPEMSAIAHYGIALIYSNNTYRSRSLYRAFDEINAALQNYDKVDLSLVGKLDNYFNGKADMKKKKNEIDAALRKKVIDANDIKVTEEFLSKAKLSAYIPEINKLYAKQSFRQALEYNTINAYEDYIKSFPMAPEAASAQQKIFSIAYDKVVKENSLEAYKNFVEK